MRLFLLIIASFSLVTAQSLKLKNLAVPDAVKKTAQQTVQAAKTQVPGVNPDGRISLIGDLSDADEQALGRETAGRILSANPAVADDALQKYVNRVGAYVASQSKRGNLAWTFAVIASDDINAFAAPGGYVLVTAGLYRMLRNEAELAGVLGHEIAHVNLRHHVRLMQKDRLVAKGQNLLSGATRVDAIRELAGPGAQIVARSLDKQSEYDSDRLGVEYAARAGYDPFAYVDALDRLAASNDTDRLSLLFKTHPTPQDRIAALEKAMGNRWDNLGGVAPARLAAMK